LLKAARQKLAQAKRFCHGALAIPTLSIVHSATRFFACFRASETLKSFSTSMSRWLAMLELVLNRHPSSRLLRPEYAHLASEPRDSRPLPMEVKTGIAFVLETYRRATGR
jgi:hypothetical protein